MGKSETVECPLWTIYNSTTSQCQCGDDLQGVVYCDREDFDISVMLCYCMNYNQKTGRTLVGKCLTRCVTPNYRSTSYCRSHNEIKTKQPEALNDEMCGYLHRTGQLCGSCMKDYGPPIYSYTIKCVKCPKSKFNVNLLKYIIVAFLPLTVFYFIIVVVKLSVTSSSMVVFVLVNQLTTMPSQIRVIVTPGSTPGRILIILASIWNLDFFRSLYTPFCIPSVTPLQVLAFDYIVGVYPLLLIYLTYIAVVLHDRYLIIAKLWRPANMLFTFIKREWNIRGSLVQAFASFLVLSYVKILNVSFDLLTPAYLQNVDGEFLKQAYVYYNGELPYFGKEHLPYGILAIIMCTVFNIVPMILLVLYPCRCFQMILNKLPFQRHALSAFMDAFQGCYHHHPRDCRYFAAIYLLIRIFQQLMFAVTRDSLYMLITASSLLLLTAAIIFFKPHKEKVYNTLGGGLCLLFALGYIHHAILVYTISYEQKQKYNAIHDYCIAVILLLATIIQSYGIVMLIMAVFPQNIQSKIKCCCRFIFTKRKDSIENTLPYRLQHGGDQGENLRLLH